MFDFSPQNPNHFTGSPLDRCSVKREDDAWVKAQLDHPKANMFCIWRGQVYVSRDTREPLWLSPSARREFYGAKGPIFLGLLNEAPYFMLDISGVHDDSQSLPFNDMAEAADHRFNGLKMPPRDLAIVGQGLWMASWHQSHTHCHKCGGATKPKMAGHKRICKMCDLEHFPRTDPVAIVLVTNTENGEEACLLGRSPNFPKGFFSALAGFLEAGETLEECAAREIFEEAGIHIDNIIYQFSQPWPFPQSMMTGFFATSNTREVNLDTDEVAEHLWVNKSDMAQILAEDKIGVKSKANEIGMAFVPPKFAIARQLLERWIEG